MKWIVEHRWYVHLLVYAAVHLLFLVLYGWTDAADAGPFGDDTANQVTNVWSVVLAVDSIVTWSYTMFPQKSKVQ